MNIVIGEKRAAEMAEKYTVLSLDTFLLPGTQDPIKSYCVLQNIPINEMVQIGNLKTLHENLMQNYGARNWSFCQQALEHLIGKWNKEVDSFYLDLASRIAKYQDEEPDLDWTPIIKKQKQDIA